MKKEHERTKFAVFTVSICIRNKLDFLLQYRRWAWQAGKYHHGISQETYRWSACTMLSGSKGMVFIETEHGVEDFYVFPLLLNFKPRKWDNLTAWSIFFVLFPTCQMRVVRFYQSCSPPRLPVLLLLLVLLLVPLLLLLLQFLLDHVCINFHLHFRLANSSPSSSPTSQLSAHCWTSTWDLPSSVRTAGPQPGTFPAQCAPLDLNLGPPQLSAHRWTSTWDLPSSVCTAGPQRPDRMPEDMPDRMSDRMPEDMPDRIPEDLPDIQIIW